MRLLELEGNDECQLRLVFESTAVPLLSQPAVSFHLTLLACRLVTWVLSLSLSPPLAHISAQELSLKPRELKAISWGLTTLLSCPRRFQQVISQAESPLRGILLPAFIIATVVLFSSHSISMGKLSPRIESKLSRAFQVRGQSRSKT